MRKSVPVLLAGLMLVLAACFEGDPEFTEDERVPAEQREASANGEGEAPAQADASVTFVAVDIDFAEAPTEVPAGVVEFELVNEGAILHNVVIDELGDQLVVEAQGGETATGTVELEPGEYSYHCSVPGHEGPMSGSFTVTD